MKKTIFLTIGAVVLYQVAKYFEITSWADFKKKLLPKLEEVKDLVYS
jgi:hypothetical protein